MTASVIYVDRHVDSTKDFTKRLAGAANTIAAEGYEIVCVVPNAGMTETIGVWIFVRPAKDRS